VRPGGCLQLLVAQSFQQRVGGRAAWFTRNACTCQPQGPCHCGEARTLHAVCRHSASGAPLVRVSAGVAVGELEQYITDHAVRGSTPLVTGASPQAWGIGRTSKDGVHGKLTPEPAELHVLHDLHVACVRSLPFMSTPVT